LVLILSISCTKYKDHCYTCIAVDSVFVTGYPDSTRLLKLLRTDTAVGKECFDHPIGLDSLFLQPYWEGTNHLIIYHKKYFYCR